MSTENENVPPRLILLGTIAAAGVAALLFVTVILPAEFDRDPLGTGALLGIKGLSSEGASDFIRTDAGVVSETRSFTLAPFEGMEFKYVLAKDASIVFEWSADAEVLCDFHGELLEGGGVKFYSSERRTADAGAFVASFGGQHGWYWENRESREVTVTLRASGFYTSAKLYRGGTVAELQTPAPSTSME